jgi:hypothetical protein
MVLTMMFSCKDCNYTTDIPDNELTNGDILSCPLCGLELEFKDGKFIEIELMDNIDWGE